MAPIKFEENMREKLEKRTIQPSAEGWSKLSSRLEEHESSFKSKGFWWLGIAASIALLIVSSLFFFSTDNEVTNTIVNKTQTTIPSNENIILEEPKEILVVNQNLNNEAISKPNESISKNTVVKQPNALKKAKINEDLALEDSKKKSTNEKVITSALKEQSTIDFREQKFNEVIAEIKSLDSDGTSVTDREIDSLLNIAHKEIITDKLIKQGSEVVNANDLLEDVELDLERSFRTRVFETVKSNYKTVKTAVAERNN